MKKGILLRPAALLMATLFLFCACANKSQTLTYKDGAYQSGNGDTSFCKAPLNYRAQSIVKGTVIFNLSRSSKRDPIPLYAIDGLSTTDWLTDENFTLYYNSDRTLPTLTEMNPCAISLRLSGDPTGTTLGYLGEDQTIAISDLMEILTKGTSHPGNKISVPHTECYELLFESKQYPGIFYVLQYLTYDESIRYIDENETIEVKKGVVYDVDADRFYVMGEILEDYFNNAG